MPAGLKRASARDLALDAAGLALSGAPAVGMMRGAGKVVPDKTYSFKPGEDVIHFEKHGSEIAEVLGDNSYDLTKYLEDANSVIKNGQFSTELNAFVSVPGGQGSAKGLMVGMDRTTGEITTMHMKPIKFFETKAPSLGWQSQPKSDLSDLIGPNPNLGWKAPYPYKSN